MVSLLQMLHTKRAIAVPFQKLLETQVLSEEAGVG
jgi:hypothetical protein